MFVRYASGQVSRNRVFGLIFIIVLKTKWTSTVTTILTGISLLGIVGTTAWFISKYQKSSSDPDELSDFDPETHGRLLSFVLDWFPFVTKHGRKRREVLDKFRLIPFVVKNYLWNLFRQWGRCCINRVKTDSAAQLEAGVSEPHLGLTEDDDLMIEATEKTRADLETASFSKSSDDASEALKTPPIMKK